MKYQYFTSESAMNLEDALESYRDIYLLRRMYEEKIVKLADQFHHYADDLSFHRGEFLNDASAFHPINPETNRRSKLSTQFRSYFKKYDGVEIISPEQAEDLLVLIFQMWDDLGDYNELSEHFPTLIQYFKWQNPDKRDSAFYLEVHDCLGLRNLILGMEKLNTVGINLQSAIHVSEAR